MRFSCTVLSVSDVSTSRRFYEELFGLQVFQDYGKNVLFTCGLSLQEDFGWLTGIPDHDIIKRPNDMEICFETEDLDGFMKKLKMHPGIETVGGVIEHGWGQRVIRLYDPDGHLIEVGEDMRMVVNKFLDSGMTLDQTSERMDVSVSDLKKLLGSRRKIRGMTSPFQFSKVFATSLRRSMIGSPWGQFISQLPHSRQSEASPWPLERLL